MQVETLANDAASQHGDARQAGVTFLRLTSSASSGGSARSSLQLAKRYSSSSSRPNDAGRPASLLLLTPSVRRSRRSPSSDGSSVSSFCLSKTRGRIKFSVCSVICNIPGTRYQIPPSEVLLFDRDRLSPQNCRCNGTFFYIPATMHKLNKIVKYRKNMQYSASVAPKLTA